MMPPDSLSNLPKPPGRFCRKWLPAFLVLVACWTSAIGVAVAAELGTNLASFVVKSWRTSDGLPQNTVTAIAQTPEGYLWVGTRAGLAQFDGVRFRTYGLADGLKNLSISSLADDGQGGLWIATRGGGLSHWREGAITTLTTADGLAHNTLTALEPAEAGAVWVGGLGGLQHFGPNGFGRVLDYQGIHGEVVALAADREGGLWFTTSHYGTLPETEPGLSGLFYCKGDRCEPVDGPPAHRQFHGYSLVVDSLGDLWVSIGNGFVLRHRAGAWTEFGETNGLPYSYVRCLAQGAPGEIWAAAQDAGLYVFHSGQFQTVLEPDAGCRVVARGKDGVIWAGTAASGLCRLTPRRLQVGVVRQEKWRGPVHGLVEGPAGDFWVGTYGAGLYHGSFGQLKPVEGLALLDEHPHLTAGLQMSNGAIYFAGAALLLRRAPATGEFQESLLTNNLTALCEGADGTLWLGTREGELLQLAGDAPLPVLKSKVPGTITGLARGPGASLWLATQGAGLVQWEAGRVRRWTTAEGLPTDALQTLHRDREEALWIGTAGGGLGWLEAGQLHTVNDRQGLADNFISQILEDDQGNLWLGCNRGISRVSKRELKEVAAGRAAVIHPLLLDESDGMVTTECTGGYSPAGLRGRSGLLYFSTVRGVVQVNPADFGPSASPPNVIIEGVDLDGKPSSKPSGPLSVPAGSRELEIHFTAFNFAKPEQIRFRYRLNGAHGDWMEATRVRSVRYSQLPPGDYAFEVTAANPDLRWQPASATLDFTVLPFFWQRLWFRGAAALLLAAAGGGAVFWHTRAKRRQELAEMERLRRESAEREKADRKFRMAVEASSNGIVLVNSDGRVVLVNAQTERLFGYSRGELIGQSVDMLVPERFRGVHPDHRAGFMASPAAREMGSGRELFARRKDGTEFAVEIGLSPFSTEEGTIVLTSVVDITARVRSEREIAQQRNELAHLSRVNMLGELSGSLAHELNQPLTAILSNAQAAVRFLAHAQPDLNEVREILADIVSEDKRAGEVIRRLRLLLKKGEVQPQALNVNDLVLEVLKLVRSDLVNQGVIAHTELALNPPVLHADRVSLQQVLINLVMNACDAMAGIAGKDRRFTITTELAGDDLVRVSVSDNGTGIPSEKLEQVFAPFYTTKAHGMGLGLSVCRTIIAAHGGELRAANNSGHGATFYFTLPVGEGK